MFEKINTKNVINNEKGDLPATTAILSNNQIGKYISKNGATILKNVFSKELEVGFFRDIFGDTADNKSSNNKKLKKQDKFKR